MIGACAMVMGAFIAPIAINAIASGDAAGPWILMISLTLMVEGAFAGREKNC